MGAALIVDFSVPTSATVTTKTDISTEVNQIDVDRIHGYGMVPC